MSGTPIFDDATRAQVEAARPDASTWLSANAGSGKTRVLTDRVARLLLGGVNPQHILCLTYTKAAASEMQNRLFKRLGEWAMLDDTELRSALFDLGAPGDLEYPRLRLARTLFAQAIEAPGGLKIQTIHSFCASLLRRFPLEAGVSPEFTEIEDRAAELLRAEIVDQMAEGPDAELIEELARYYSGEDLGKLTQAVVGNRERFATRRSLADILEVFGLPADFNDKILLENVFVGREKEIFSAIIPTMLSKGGNDTKAAMLLQGIQTLGIDALPILESVFLTGATAKSPFSAKIGSFPTKPTRELLASSMPALEDLMTRVEDAREARLGLIAAQRSFALHQFAYQFNQRYQNEKQQRGWLDFDDLILRARALLSDSKAAAWVQYRIDGGIDHILVDEAQDTSPRQWDVISQLAAEFTVGIGVKESQDRTLFVVGDKKQSIYSFQGADPAEFDNKKDEFRDKFERAGLNFQNRSLEYSFRSSSAILSVVDQTFSREATVGLGDGSLHRAFNPSLPGRVDVWPLIETMQEEENDQHWSTPLDRPNPQHHDVLLAEKIAESIHDLIEEEHYIPDQDRQGNPYRRRITAGDFLILVQRRSGLFSEIIRACKARELPIAGADRLKVGAELAVRDLAALLSFLATPEDSLSLATALRSPLLGWSEQELFTLAHHRSEPFLWQSLRGLSDTHPKTVAMLRDLRAHVDYLRPYDLIERILILHDGRRKLLARLGREAEDGIDALLDQALAYERNSVPSLTGFLVWMETDDLEIKRQIDSASDQVRVMTVHGAKGLEAPIVILPDTAKRKSPNAPEILELDGVAIWRPRSDQMPARAMKAVEAHKSAQMQERLRLLYVAMTRAEKWLIVAAAGELSKQSDTWYQMVDDAITTLGTQHIDGFKRYAEHEWDAWPIAEVSFSEIDFCGLETHFQRPVGSVPVRDRTISPSELGGEKALSGLEGMQEDSAKKFGSMIHVALESLSNDPDVDVQEVLLVHSSGIDPTYIEVAQAEIAAIRKLDIFSQPALTEVPVSAQFGALRLHGSIDRLIITETEILAIDYKTNREVPQHPEDCPEGLKRQLGAYAHILNEIYPERHVRTAILWTKTATLMVFPHDIVRSALMRSPYLDGAAAGS